MRSVLLRVALLATVLMGLAACGVSDADLEHWKHTQRGPRKITTVLVEPRYPAALRVHAARALIEMKHPNANGLDLLQGAMQAMPAPDREAIVHALLPEIRTMLAITRGGTVTAPTEPQVKAKDAAYVLLRGDGHTAFAGGEDRNVLANTVLDWILLDFNTRALAGSYTAEQVVTAIGPSAAAVRTVTIARELEGNQATDRLRATAERLLRQANRTITPEIVASTANQLRDRYLSSFFEAIRTLAQREGTDYLLSVAASSTPPIERRKAALTAAAGQVTAAHSATLLDIARCGAPAAAPPPPGRNPPTPPTPPTPAPACDVELRGLAVDRLGETRDRNVTTTLQTLFDTSNGSAANGEFTLRWKLGEALIKLGGAAYIPTFMQHLAQPRPAAPAFAGWTYAELNGEAQALSDLAPPPRDVMRGFLASTNALQVRLLAILFLGIKGEERDLATLQAMAGEATPVAGEGWAEAQLTTAGAVATRAREGLQTILHPPQAPGASPTPANP